MLSTGGMRSLLIAAAALLALPAAHAGGSITLAEVIEQLSDDNKLMNAIFDELYAQKIRAEDVICTGARFGGHWRMLGGGRAVPFECQIGKRKLTIEGTVHLFDDEGKELSIDDDGAPDRAVEYNQRDLKWSWK